MNQVVETMEKYLDEIRIMMFPLDEQIVSYFQEIDHEKWFHSLHDPNYYAKLE